MKKLLIALLICSLLAIGCSSNDGKENELEEQQRMVQATTQIVLRNYNIDERTSPSLEDWNINKQEYNGTIRWTATTNGNNNSKIKCIFEWSGKDNDDLTLIYLLYNGKEIINDLK